MTTIIKFLIALLFALFMPKFGSSQTLTLCATGSAALDGQYHFAPRWQAAAEQGPVTRAFTKAVGTRTYVVYLIENEMSAQWVVADNVGNEYFHIVSEEKIPDQTPDGWAISREGEGLNGRFTLLYEAGNTPVFEPDNGQTEVSPSAALPVAITDRAETEDLVAAVPALLYPNPSKGTVRIATDAAVQHISVLDQTGRTMIETSGQQFDIKDLPMGVYTVQIETAAGDFVRQLSKL